LAIEKAEFEKGAPGRSLCDRILEFLLKNGDKAYLEIEITRNMVDEAPVLKTLTSVGMQTLVLATLDKLVADGKVVTRVPGSSPYYMAVPISEILQSAKDHVQDSDNPHPNKQG
jgi:hypothetical protein